jgi:hypothetical protein
VSVGVFCGALFTGAKSYIGGMIVAKSCLKVLPLAVPWSLYGEQEALTYSDLAGFVNHSSAVENHLMHCQRLSPRMLEVARFLIVAPKLLASFLKEQLGLH